MKKIHYIILGISFLISSCDLTDPLKEKRESVSDNLVQNFEYTVSDDDFATLTKRALYLDPADTTNVAFLKANHFFTDEVPASTYVPMLMDVLYPGLGTGSQARVSYLYNGNSPDDLLAYTAAPVFTFAPADYRMAADAVADANYFSPRYNPDLLLPGILAEQLDTASSGAIYAIQFNYS
nr:hypothetical protein [Prolixibacteraceae bacterium]